MIQLKKKLIKQTITDAVLFTLNFTSLLDSDDILIASIQSSSVETNTLSIDYLQINTIDITVEDEDIAAYKAVQIQLSGGVLNNEYVVTIMVRTNDDEDIEIQFIVVVSKLIFNYYGAANYADNYFALRLNNDFWMDASSAEKMKALVTATKSIDRLNFVGDKTDDDQTLQFPRDEEIDIPESIIEACYEEAYNLLSGADAQMEQANLSAISRGIASVRTTYDRTTVPENVKAGITSYLAWNLLMPFLRDPGEIIISRV